MQITYKRKLKLNKDQEQRIRQWIGTCRYVYNLCLELEIGLWNQRRKYASVIDLSKQLPELRKEVDWINDVPAQVLQQVLKRLDQSYKNFFNGKEFPKFAKKGKYNSIIFPQHVVVDGYKIKVAKLGWLRTFKDNRNITGLIKRAIITQELDGFYISIPVEKEKEQINNFNKNQVGIDMGIVNFATLTDNKGISKFIENPKHYAKYEKKLRVENRALARKTQGSANWNKQKYRLAKTHRKIMRVRNDFLHKLSINIVNQYGYISVEDLKVSNMIKFGNLSKHIADAGWSRFFDFLEYKSEWRNSIFTRINPRYTSQTCNSCGEVNKQSRISQSEFVCISCGVVAHADVNASKNILRLGQSQWALT